VARKEGLDFFDTIFEVVDFDQLNQVAAYGGFPQRYPHWRFGMQYDKLRKQHVYGLGKIYEMVINNDPCYAYLLPTTDFVDQKLVMAHVYGSLRLLQEQRTGSARPIASMMDGMANHATRIHRHIDRFGLDQVEQFIDTCLSLENLIDPHAVHATPAEARPPRRDRPIAHGENEGVRFPASRTWKSYINPPERLGPAEQRSLPEASGAQEACFRAAPLRDVLQFLLERAAGGLGVGHPCHHPRRGVLLRAAGHDEDHERGLGDVLALADDDAKILGDDELITYADHHSGTLAMGPGQPQPVQDGRRAVPRHRGTLEQGALWQGVREVRDDRAGRQLGHEAGPGRRRSLRCAGSTTT
jgi:stage V sporulation protein R